MRMLADFVLVKPEDRKTVKIGSIVLPDNATVQQAFARGIVERVGPGCYLPYGDQIPPDIEVGDKVLYFKDQAIPIVVEQRDMHIVKERNLIGVFEGEDTEAPREKIENSGVGFGE